MCGCGPREFVILGLLLISISLVSLAVLSIASLDAATTATTAIPLAGLLGTGTAVRGGRVERGAGTGRGGVG